MVKEVAAPITYIRDIHSPMYPAFVHSQEGRRGDRPRSGCATPRSSSATRSCCASSRLGARRMASSRRSWERSGRRWPLPPGRQSRASRRRQGTLARRGEQGGVARKENEERRGARGGERRSRPAQSSREHIGKMSQADHFQLGIPRWRKFPELQSLARVTSQRERGSHGHSAWWSPRDAIFPRSQASNGLVG